MPPVIIISCLVIILLHSPAQACTAIAVGRLATDDASTYAGSTSDCLNCDFRLAKVPSREHPPGSKRPIYLVKADYPHVIQDGRAPTWELDNLEASPTQARIWKVTQPIGYIPQVNRTYALLETGSGYALINEHGVAMGESSCPAEFVAAPISDGGYALFDISELGRVALERSSTAREAIKLMGSLAEQYGYYGAEWNTHAKYFEAGEALTVTDKHEAWVFHILPDDTGKSAIWVAQRVPDTDITVVANNFVIRDVDVSNEDDFMYSKNMFEVAERNGLWNSRKQGKSLDFTKVYGNLRKASHSMYSTARVWRLFTLVRPALLDELSAHPNALMDGYPFSVTPTSQLSASDLFKIFRDHYEGSRFDLTNSPAGGPYGDPDRYDARQTGNMSRARAFAGEFGRAISISRTSYTGLARSKGSLPDLIGPLLYFAPQQPSSSVFIPIYVSAETVPLPLTRGSLFRYSNDSLFWAVTLISNWVHKYYLHAVGDLRNFQEEFERYNIIESDRKAWKYLKQGNSQQAIQIMEAFGSSMTTKIHEGYVEFFASLVARFHDGFRMESSEDERVQMTSLFYPEWWLKSVGYFSARETGGSYGMKFEEAEEYVSNLAKGSLEDISHIAVFLFGLALGAGCCIFLFFYSTDVFKGPSGMGYTRI